MPASPLYLFKTARRALYRKENLTLLAAERGSVHEFAWNRTWVAPELFDEGTIPRGRPVHFVFAERPYELFVPVREGTVVDAAWDDLTLRIRVLLGNPVRAGADGDLDAFTRAVREALGEEAPGNLFVVPKRDDVELQPRFDHHEIPAWEATVDGILRLSRETREDPYGGTVFFRSRGAARDDGELVPSRALALEPGDAGALHLRFYNPHLEPADLEALELAAVTPPGALEVDAPARVPRTGDLEIPFVMRDGPEPRLRVEIRPGPGRHCQVVQRLARKGEEHRVAVPYAGVGEHAGAGSETEGAEGAGVESAAEVGRRKDGMGRSGAAASEEVRRVLDTVWRKLPEDDAEARLDVLGAFERLLPGDPRVLERRARVHHDRGEAERAREILTGVNPEMLPVWARRLLFRHAVRAEAGAGDPFEVLERYAIPVEVEAEVDGDAENEGGGPDEAAEPPLLLAEMDGLDARTLGRLLPALMTRVPDRTVCRVLVERYGARLTDPATVRGIAEVLWLQADHPDLAYRFLSERRPHLGRTDGETVERLLELADAAGHDVLEPELAEVVGMRIRNLVGMDELDGARALLQKARDALSGETRTGLYRSVARRLAGKGRTEEAVGILMELAESHLAGGDLLAASEAVEAAAGQGAAAAGGASESHGEDGADRGEEGLLGAKLADLRRRVEAAWAENEALVEWRRSEEERRREALRARLLNRCVLIAGGMRKPEWEEGLEDLTGATVEWCENVHHDGDDLRAVAERIRAGRYAAVVHRLQKTGHDTGDVLKPACEDAGVPWLHTPTAGRRGVEAALWGWVSGG